MSKRPYEVAMCGTCDTATPYCRCLSDHAPYAGGVTIEYTEADIAALAMRGFVVMERPGDLPIVLPANSSLTAQFQSPPLDLAALDLDIAMCGATG